MITTGTLLGLAVLLVLNIVQHVRIVNRLETIEARQRFQIDLTMTWAANWGSEPVEIRAALDRIIKRFNGGADQAG